MAEEQEAEQRAEREAGLHGGGIGGCGGGDYCHDDGEPALSMSQRFDLMVRLRVPEEKKGGYWILRGEAEFLL